jgi:uncharacterized metal-binding protein YceD (DUF177 family)
VNPGRRATLPSLVVALEDVPPEGLDRPLNIKPEDLAALVAGDEEEPPSFVTALTGTIRLRRLGARLEVRGSFRVGASLACDRCLALTRADLTGEIEESLPLAADSRAEEAEEDALAVTDGLVDLAGLLAESFWLAWPYRFICRPDCAGLCPACGADLNQGACGCSRPA